MKLSPYYFTPVICWAYSPLVRDCSFQVDERRPFHCRNRDRLGADVLPSVETVSSGKSKHLTAVATFGDGSKKTSPMTRNGRRTIPRPRLSTTRGTVVGVSTGITSVKVTYGGAKASTTVTVTP